MKSNLNQATKKYQTMIEDTLTKTSRIIRKWICPKCGRLNKWTGFIEAGFPNFKLSDRGAVCKKCNLGYGTNEYYKTRRKKANLN